MGYCFRWCVKRLIYPLAIFILVLSQPAFAQQKVYVAVASNFINVFEKLKSSYISQQQDAPSDVADVEIVASYGSSGKLFAQIVHGAPFHIFLSADTDKPKKLVELALTQNQTVYTYALGQLVLVANNSEISPIDMLKQQKFKHIAIANPKLAPYGLAAQNVIDSLGLKINRRQIAMGENISQSYQFFTSKHAQLAFVAYAQIFNQPEINVWLVPDNLYHPIEQGMVLLKSAEHNNAATQFYQFLQSQQAQCLIASLGYKSQTCLH